MQKVVNLGEVKDLRQEWDKVRAGINAARVASFFLLVADQDGHESIFTGGAYKSQPEKAARAALRVSAARMMLEDSPPDFQVTAN